MLGRRIKQQRCSNELTGWMQAPPPPDFPLTSSNTPHLFLHLHPGTPPYPTLRSSSSSSSSSFLVLSSSNAVKVGREVRCLRELREHSCLFQTGHPCPTHPASSPAAPIHLGSDKRHLYSPCAWKPLWGLLSLHSYTHLHFFQHVCVCVCVCHSVEKFVRGKQSMCMFLCWNTRTHARAWIH